MFRDENGPTGHCRVVTRADVLAAALDALSAGVTQLADAEQLADRAAPAGG